MRDGDDACLMGVRKVGSAIEWRKDRVWGENDGPWHTIKKYIELQNVMHNFEQK